jgi:hypothetical protein
MLMNCQMAAWISALVPLLFDLGGPDQKSTAAHDLGHQS